MSARLLILAALILAPAITLASVRAEVSATVGDDGIAQVRRKVLASALTETLKTIINRHLPAEELKPHRRALSAIYKNTSKYISRYTIEAEGQRLDRYRLSVVAEVDQKRLLSKLEALGLAPRSLGAKPRVLIASPPDEDSAALAAIVTARFTEEKFSAAYREFAPPPESVTLETTGESEAAEVVSDAEVVFEVDDTQVEELAQAGFAGIRHIACGVSLIVDEPEKEEEDATSAKDEAPPFMQSLPPIFEVDENGALIMEGDASTPPEEKIELKAGGFIVDALSGFLLSKHVAVAMGRGPDLATARQDALDKLASELYQHFVAQLTHARWTPPGEEETFEIRIEGVTSPAQIGPVSNALKSLTELQALNLARIERHTVVWRARGTDPGFGWAEIASNAKLKGAALGWQMVTPEGQSSATGLPTAQSGTGYTGAGRGSATRGVTHLSVPQPESPPQILLGRFVAP